LFFFFLEKRGEFWDGMNLHEKWRKNKNLFRNKREKVSKGVFQVEKNEEKNGRPLL
jgi:hypothetical protein